MTAIASATLETQEKISRQPNQMIKHAQKNTDDQPNGQTIQVIETRQTPSHHKSISAKPNPAPTKKA